MTKAGEKYFVQELEMCLNRLKLRLGMPAPEGNQMTVDEALEHVVNTHKFISENSNLYENCH